VALSLEIVGDVPTTVSLEATNRIVSALIAAVPALPDGIINATFVDRDSSREFNQKYSGNDYPTDVLSFSYIEDGEAIGGVIGELAVCTEIALEQSEEAGTAVSDEVALLILHGILHICGYDHQTPAQQSKLQRIQLELMMTAGNQYREFVWET
jgi:probable rRNA maturation factor